MHPHFLEKPSVVRARRVRVIHARARRKLAQLRAHRERLIADFEATVGSGRVRALFAGARAKLDQLIESQRAIIARFIKGAEASQMEKARERLDEL